ncbi:MAG: putative N-acetylmannosamine-6-phosphate 2-epimerase [Devosia indica]
MTTSLLDTLRGGLIVSCQPVDNGPLDSIPAIVGFALAARDGGARALRIEGADNVAAVAKACDLPIIGIVKRDLSTSPVRITPYIEDVAALAAAGAHVIAVDATLRERPVAVAELLAAIRGYGRLAMADLSTIEEAHAAFAMGFDILGTTMSGYTGGSIPDGPDLAFVTANKALGGFVVAEGRYNSPSLAAAAILAGADAVCAGSAITRTEHVTGWFAKAVADADRRRGETVLAFDIGGTKTLAALVRGETVIDRRLVPTPPDVGSAGWFDAIADMAADWRGEYHVAGVAATGLVRDGLWNALNPGTLAIPPNTPLSGELARRLNCPIVARNDAQAAAWGEYQFGAGQQRDMAFVTVSSGIGGGIVLGGRLVEGARGLAGSLGQVQGSKGDLRLEDLASGFAMAATAGEAGLPEDTRLLFDAAKAGNTMAGKILDRSAARIATGLVDLQRLVDPQVVVVGGGVGLAPAFQAALHRSLELFDTGLRPHVVFAALGADAGLVGIGHLAQQSDAM